MLNSSNDARSRIRLQALANLTMSAHDVATMLDSGPAALISQTESDRFELPALQNLFSLWKRLVLGREQVPLPTYQYECAQGHLHTIEGPDVRGRLLLTITGHFDYILHKYLISESPTLSKIFVFKTIDQFSADPTVAESPRESCFRVFSALYLGAIGMLNVVAMLRRSHIRLPHLDAVEQLVHEQLCGLLKVSHSVIGNGERAAAQLLTVGALEYAKQVYSRPDPIVNSDHCFGVFSLLRPAELALLARRDSTMISKYGQKAVEKVLERQLSLLMQSLGLVVVTTRLYQKTVDLICIGSNTDARITFLLEAKSTKGRYSLPAKDARALNDYVKDTLRSLGTLPPLAFVLIVGGRPSRTLRGKLAKLEVTAGVPVRYMTAQQLADIRERMVGPLPLGLFASVLLAGSHITADSLITKVIESYNLEQRAHSEFVEALMVARGIVPGECGQD
jgi:hypothetical protein